MRVTSNAPDPASNIGAPNSHPHAASKIPTTIVIRGKSLLFNLAFLLKQSQALASATKAHAAMKMGTA